MSFSYSSLWRRDSTYHFRERERSRSRSRSRENAGGYHSIRSSNRTWNENANNYSRNSIWRREQIRHSNSYYNYAETQNNQRRYEDFNQNHFQNNQHSCRRHRNNNGQWRRRQNGNGSCNRRRSHPFPLIINDRQVLYFGEWFSKFNKRIVLLAMAHCILINSRSILIKLKLFYPELYEKMKVFYKKYGANSDDSVDWHCAYGIEMLLKHHFCKGGKKVLKQKGNLYFKNEKFELAVSRLKRNGSKNGVKNTSASPSIVSLCEAPSDDIPHQYQCPISLQLMADPVIMNDGHYYDSSSLMEWLEISNRSPMTNLVIPDIKIRHDLALKEEIVRWVKNWNQQNKQ